MHHHRNGNLVARVAIGAAAGVLGTMALGGIMAARSKVYPRGDAPIEQEPGEFMVEQAEKILPESVRRNVPLKLEDKVASNLGFGYGAAFGALYGALRPMVGSIFGEGATLGIACWAAGYLGWLPAAGLMVPVWQQKIPQAVTPVAEHVAFGVATVAAYDHLNYWFGEE